MHISRVELENIKSHTAATFEFSSGTTAITGENGAGKTTIIEAIAWALFDVLEYKKEDFVRRGAKKGSATVTFESGLDEREYIVYRDSGAGYHVTDPRLRTRIADKKEEVFRFLWQHLGVEPGTDLRSLFRQAIGVPQGTLTAIFLEGATDRKIAFDRLLKVEEYRQAAEKLRETSRLLDTQVVSARETIARAEGALARSEFVTEEHKTIAAQAAALAAEMETISTQLASSQERVRHLDEQERRVSGLKAAVDRSNAEKEKAELLAAQAEKALIRAKDATAKIETVRSGHESHVATLGRLGELERERGSRDRLRAEHAKNEAAIVNVRADGKRFEHDLKSIQNARKEIEDLRPRAEEQDSIEKDIAAFRSLIARAQTADERIESIDRQLGGMREKYRVNHEALKDAEAKSAAANSLPELEQRDARIVEDLATLRANLERDQKFQIEIKGGFCPILSQKCLNLKEGETLESFLSSQFTDNKAQIATLETERSAVATALAQAREASQLLAALEGYRSREEELKETAAGVKEKRAILEKEQRELADAERKIADAENRLKKLEDPAARIRVLEKEVGREQAIRVGLSDVESNLERLNSERKLLDEQLSEFKELDEMWTRLTSERDSTAEAHRAFLANEGEAAQLATRQKEHDEARSSLAEKITAAETAERDLAAAGIDYNAELHARERAELLNTERRSAETKATLDAARQREKQLAAEIDQFAQIRKALAAEFQEKERLEKVAEATAFIRDTLKEAAPRVARNYVYHVSAEANQMFREITGNGERSLRWAEDYSIFLEEDGFERPFVSLSGGEQMAAALAVRLALLKQLSDIRIAFFDEPTANMDETRRENFAQQISRITHFDQLFVISHDDTFDSYVDHVIAV